MFSRERKWIKLDTIIGEIDREIEYHEMVIRNYKRLMGDNNSNTVYEQISDEKFLDGEKESIIALREFKNRCIRMKTRGRA